MESNKILVNVSPINNGEQNFCEIVVREGAAVKLLEPKPPVKTQLSGTIGTVLEYLEKRIDTQQFAQERAYIIVNREDVEISLIINENNEYERGIITGKLTTHPAFKEFGINTGKMWAPHELGMFMKMHRIFFADRNENMEIVTKLMNFEAHVNNQLTRSYKESGDRTDNFAQIVNSNIPPRFTLQIPLFKGMAPETLEIETFVKINGRDVFFTLLSPAANETLETVRDTTIDKQLSKIVAVAPDIAIIEE